MDYIITYDDGTEALAHYGVLGMRWGVRHDKGYKASVKSIKQSFKGQHGKEARIAKKNAINDAKTAAADRLYSTNSSATNRKIQTRSKLGTLGMTALYSSYGAMHYDRARTGEGYSRGKAFVRGLMSGTLNNATKPLVPVMGVAGTHNYIKDRQGRGVGKTSKDVNRRYVKL